jgi:hypothetical protein
MLFFMPLVRNGKKILGASVGILIFVFTVRPSKTGDTRIVYILYRNLGYLYFV